MKKVLTLENNIQQITQLQEFVEAVCEEISAAPTLAFELNLALEEAVANVINYAYPKDEVHTFELTATTGDNELIFELKDSGTPFDPTSEATKPDTTLPAEERPIGGLGIFLIRQLMQRVEYKRENGYNILTLGKKIN